MPKPSESAFFHNIAPTIINFVRESSKEMTVVENKGLVGDYSTHVDVGTENLIVSELKKHFPNDQILAEEGFSDTKISQGRIWIIDPICGTNNLGKGINNFCTNIALVDDGVVTAACAVDHSQGEYFWSVGEGKVFVNSDIHVPPSPGLGQKIDIDFGSVRKSDAALRKKHNNCLKKLIEETDFDLISLNTSLGFAYTAIGKTDGFINLFNYPWDISAASFLIQQAGGVVTGLDSAPWAVSTVGAIGGRTPEVHKQLLDLFKQS